MQKTAYGARVKIFLRKGKHRLVESEKSFHDNIQDEQFNLFKWEKDYI